MPLCLRVSPASSSDPRIQLTMLFPARPFGSGKIGSVMGTNTIFSPERGFRHAMRYLNHILDLQIGPPSKGSGHHLFPSHELSRSANERLPRTDEPHLSPHSPSKRAAHFFGILQSFQPTAPQALHMVSQIGHRITRGPGDSGNAGPHPKYQSLQQ